MAPAPTTPAAAAATTPPPSGSPAPGKAAYTPPAPAAPAGKSPLPAAEAPAAAPPADLVAIAATAPTVDALCAAAANCEGCGLAEGRQRVAFHSGAGARRVLFVEDAPRASTDANGSYLEGPSGELLANIVTKGMGITLEDVQLTALVKCRPGVGSMAGAAEVAACRAWLDRQAALVDPTVIICLGRPAAAGLLGIDAPLGRLRGTVHRTELGGETRQVICSYHPDFLVRAPENKKKAWEDIQLAMSVAGIPLPGRG